MGELLALLLIERKRAEQEAAAHAVLHDHLDAELGDVMAELDRMSASVATDDLAAVTTSMVTDPAPSSSEPQGNYDEQWDKYDDYGE